MEKRKPLNVEATLVFKKHLTPDVIDLHFETNPAFAFDPGQFMSIIIPGRGPGGRDLRRAYSIASSPELMRDGKQIMELCVKIVENGPGTQYLNSLQIGDQIKGLAPYGDFVYKTKNHRHVIFVSTGTGIAPFRSMLYSQSYLENKPLTTTLLYGARDTHDLLYTDEMRHVLGSKFVQTLSKPKHGWEGSKGRVTDWIKANCDHIHFKETEFYLCGNGAMIDEMKKILAECGVEKDSIHQEVYYKPKPGQTHAN